MENKQKKNETFNIKLNLLKEKIDIKITSDYKDFISNICNILLISQDQFNSLLFSYIDEDGDSITISTEEDYMIFVQQIKEKFVNDLYIEFKQDSNIDQNICLGNALDYQEQIEKENNNIIKNNNKINNNFNDNYINNNMNNNPNKNNNNFRVGLKMTINKNNPNIPSSNNNNMNRNQTANNINRNMNSNNIINQALSMIRDEFRKKDEKIRVLERKVEELEKKISLIMKNNNNNYMDDSNNKNKEPQVKIGKNFTFSDKLSEEINYNSNIREQNNYNNYLTNPTKGINNDISNNPFNKKEVNKRIVNYQNIPNNQHRMDPMKENEFDLSQQKNKDINNDNQRENSIKTWNSGNYHGWTKIDVKLYLKEVKSKLPPDEFKEFIHSIKLLTSSRTQENVDRDSVVEKVRNLLEGRFDDLFNKFKAIIGYNE